MKGITIGFGALVVLIVWAGISINSRARSQPPIDATTFATTPAPPTPAAKEAFCNRAAGQVETLLAEQDTKKNTLIFGPSDGRITDVRADIARPNTCFGLLWSESFRAPRRIVFSSDWFRGWDKSRDGAFEVEP